MKNKCGFGECNYFFEFISIIGLIISYILIVVQSFNNHNFNKSNSKEIKAEKYLYRHFSEEIYSNIRRYPLQKIIPSEKNDSNYNYINLEVKLDSYFDCRGVKKGLLNEECQDKVINNFTCCRSDCCIKRKGEIFCNNYNFDLRKSYLDNTILTYNDEERIEDPRRRYCKYFNLHNGMTSNIFNKYFQVEYFNYNYEDLLFKEEEKNSIFIGKNPPVGFTDCGQLDTLNNHLYLKNISCPINFVLRDKNNLYFDSISSTSLVIFVRNFLSEIPPDIHDSPNNIKNKNESISNLTSQDSGSKNVNEEEEFNFTNIKDLYKIIKEKKYYKEQEAYFYINELPDFYDIYKDKVNKYQKLYWYSTNYIGFNSSHDLQKFKSIFNENNMEDNPLYKITLGLLPTYILGIICIFLIILCIVYIIFFFIFLKINTSCKTILFYTKEIIIFISFFIGIALYLKYSNNKYNTININIDEHYKDILNLYNKRKQQKYFLTGIIIMSFIIVYEIYFICFANTNMKNEKEIDKGSDFSSSNNENNNSLRNNRRNGSNRINENSRERPLNRRNVSNRSNEMISSEQVYNIRNEENIGNEIIEIQDRANIKSSLNTNRPLRLHQH